MVSVLKLVPVLQARLKRKPGVVIYGDMCVRARVCTWKRLRREWGSDDRQIGEGKVR